jgi:hypothetical protein
MVFLREPAVYASVQLPVVGFRCETSDIVKILTPHTVHPPVAQELADPQPVPVTASPLMHTLQPNGKYRICELELAIPAQLNVSEVYGSLNAMLQGAINRDNSVIADYRYGCSIEDARVVQVSDKPEEADAFVTGDHATCIILTPERPEYVQPQQGDTVYQPTSKDERVQVARRYLVFAVDFAIDGEHVTTDMRPYQDVLVSHALTDLETYIGFTDYLTPNNDNKSLPAVPVYVIGYALQDTFKTRPTGE